MVQVHINTELNTDQTKVKYYDRNCFCFITYIKRFYDRAYIKKFVKRLFEIQTSGSERGKPRKSSIYL